MAISSKGSTEMTTKKLSTLDVKEIAEQSDTEAISMHSKTWYRLIGTVPMQNVPGHPNQQPSSVRGGNTFSGKPVILDDTLPEEEVRKIPKTKS